MMASGDGNGRVTNAILATKLDALIDDVHEYHDEVKANGGRIRDLEIEVASQKERLGTACDEVKTLRSRSTVWDFINSFGAIGAFVAALFKS